jgi:hypothetical protein
MLVMRIAFQLMWYTAYDGIFAAGAPGTSSGTLKLMLKLQKMSNKNRLPKLKINSDKGIGG